MIFIFVRSRIQTLQKANDNCLITSFELGMNEAIVRKVELKASPPIVKGAIGLVTTTAVIRTFIIGVLKSGGRFSTR